MELSEHMNGRVLRPPFLVKKSNWWGRSRMSATLFSER